MRGKAHWHIMLLFDSGITPAYAGKRYSITQFVATSQDHPRLCGEKHAKPSFSAIWIGSPPPMRGKGFGDDAEIAGIGITPAYAGKSCQNHGGT